MSIYKTKEVIKFENNVVLELYKALSEYPDFHSAHEGYAVLKEEIDELWDDIKKFKGLKSKQFEKELIQIAAIALRFYLNICCEDTEDLRSSNPGRIEKGDEPM